MQPTKNRRFRQVIAQIFLIVVATLFTGCATVINGTKGPFEVTTEPPMAAVEVRYGANLEEIESAWTPHTFVLPKKRDVTVLITREGYEPVLVQANSFKGDFSLGQAAGIATAAISPIVGLPLLGVDKISGAHLTRNGIHVKLQPLKQGAVADRAPPGAHQVPGAVNGGPPVAAMQPEYHYPTQQVYGGGAIVGEPVQVVQQPVYVQPRGRPEVWSPFPSWHGADGVVRDFTEFQFGRVRQSPTPGSPEAAQVSGQRYTRPAGGLVTQKAGGLVQPASGLRGNP